MGQFGIGQSVKRFEDVRLLRGEGRFHRRMAQHTFQSFADGRKDHA